MPIKTEDWNQFEGCDFFSSSPLFPPTHTAGTDPNEKPAPTWEKRMSKVNISRRIQFCAGHRLYQHESKCRNLHGHNYVVHVHAQANKLDHLGRVIDFSILKDKIGGWIDDNWDHGFIYCEQDDICRKVFKNIQMFMEMKIFVLPCNPTAENMAEYLLNTVCPNLMKGTGVEVFKIVLEETENCCATVTNEK